MTGGPLCPRPSVARRRARESSVEESGTGAAAPAPHPRQRCAHRHQGHHAARCASRAGRHAGGARGVLSHARRAGAARRTLDAAAFLPAPVVLPARAAAEAHDGPPHPARRRAVFDGAWRAGAGTEGQARGPRRTRGRPRGAARADADRPAERAGVGRVALHTARERRRRRPRRSPAARQPAACGAAGRRHRPGAPSGAARREDPGDVAGARAAPAEPRRPRLWCERHPPSFTPTASARR